MSAIQEKTSPPKPATISTKPATLFMRSTKQPVFLVQREHVVVNGCPGTDFLVSSLIGRMGGNSAFLGGTCSLGTRSPGNLDGVEQMSLGADGQVGTGSLDFW